MASYSDLVVNVAAGDSGSATTGDTVYTVPSGRRAEMSIGVTVGSGVPGVTINSRQVSNTASSTIALNLNFKVNAGDIVRVTGGGSISYKFTAFEYSNP